MPVMPRLISWGGAGAAEEVTVVGFSSTATVFRSKQLPKKLLLYGSDLR